jgi:hypothetical protein|tara:strand:- start:707 stop:871 length:165 start_codon:yes stop_codon:yes gene_type:complete
MKVYLKWIPGLVFAGGLMVGCGGHDHDHDHDHNTSQQNLPEGSEQVSLSIEGMT